MKVQGKYRKIWERLVKMAGALEKGWQTLERREESEKDI